MMGMNVNLVALLAKQMSTEDRILLLSELLGCMFDSNDFDVGLAMYEMRYKLEPDEERKKSQAGLIEFIREINTLRPHAKKFNSLMQTQIRKMEEGR